MRRQDYNKRKPNNDNRSSSNISNQRGLLNMPPGLMNNQNSLMGGHAGLFGGNQGRMMGQGNMMGAPGGLFDNQSGLLNNQPGMLGNRSGGMIGGNSAAFMATQAGLLRNQLGMLDNQGILGMAGQDLLKNQNLLGMLANRNINSLMGSQLNSLGPGLNNFQGSVNLGGSQTDAITSLLGDVTRGNSRERSNDWSHSSFGQAGILGPPPDGRRVMPLLSGDGGALGMGPAMGHKRALSHSFQDSRHGGDSKRSNTGFANTCDVCNWSYNSTYMEHCNTLDHMKKVRLVKKGCLLCKTGKFKNYPDYVKHLDGTKHKQNKEKLNKDLEAKRKNTEMAKSNDQKDLSLDKETPAIVNGAGCKTVVEENPLPDADDEMKMDDVAEGECDLCPKSESIVYDPNVAVGQEHVISVTGYFCKLCRKFYNNEVAAKVNHCKSEAHFQKFQDTLKLK